MLVMCFFGLGMCHLDLNPQVLTNTWLDATEVFVFMRVRDWNYFSLAFVPMAPFFDERDGCQVSIKQMVWRWDNSREMICNFCMSQENFRYSFGPVVLMYCGENAILETKKFLGKNLTELALRIQCNNESCVLLFWIIASTRCAVLFHFGPCPLWMCGRFFILLIIVV